MPPENGLAHLESQARTGLIDDVVIAIPWHEDDRIMAIVSKLRELTVNVYLLSDLVGFRTKFRSPPSHFGELPILQVVGKPMSGWDGAIKTIEDLRTGATYSRHRCAAACADRLRRQTRQSGPGIVSAETCRLQQPGFRCLQVSLHAAHDMCLQEKRSRQRPTICA